MCKPFLVLHCNYNGEICQKFDLVITFDWRVLLTLDQRVWTAFCKIFSGICHLIISGAPKCSPKYAKYAYLGAYLGARNMVKWGVPAKILQKVVHRSIGPSSQKLWPNQFFGWFPHSDGWQWIVYGFINLKFGMQPSFAQRNAHAEDWGRIEIQKKLVQPIVQCTSLTTKNCPEAQDMPRGIFQGQWISRDLHFKSQYIPSSYHQSSPGVVSSIV